MTDSRSRTRRTTQRSSKRAAKHTSKKKTSPATESDHPSVAVASEGARAVLTGRSERARHPWLALGLILGFAASIVGGLWFVYASGMVANRFKPDIERELSKALNRPVVIERLEGGIFDRVVLRHVTIGAPASDAKSLEITIERVVVRYSLWDILVKKKALADGLREIQLIRPLIRFERDAQGQWHHPNLIAWTNPDDPSKLTTIPPIKVTLTQGEIRFSDPKRTTSLHHVRGMLNLKDPTQVPLYLSGRTDSQRLQNVKVSGELNLNRRQFRVGLSAEHIRLRPVERLAQVSSFFEVMDGEATVSLKAASRETRPNDLIPGVDVRGKLILENCELATSVIKEPLKGLYGVTVWDNDRITLKNMQALLGKTVWLAHGQVEHLKDPFISIKVQSDHLKLSDLVGTFPKLGQLKTVGEGSAVILIKGTVPDLVATATIRLANGKIGQMPIKNFESICKYTKGELKLLLAKGIVAHGTAEGQGKIVFSEDTRRSPSLEFKLRGQNLEMGELASLFKFTALRGTANAELMVNGTLEEPTLRGDVDAASIRAGQNEFKNIKGTVLYSPQTVSFSAKTQWGELPDLTLALQMDRRKQGWKIQPLRVFLKNEEVFSADGLYNVDGKKNMDIRFRGNKLPIAQSPLIPAAWKHLNGWFAVNGTCLGTLEHPQVRLKFSTPRLLRDSDLSIPVRGDVELDTRWLRIHTLNVDANHASISGIIDLDQKSIQTLALQLERFSLAQLMPMAGVSTKVQGWVQGSIQLNGSFQQIQSKGEVTFQDVHGYGIQAQTGKLLFSGTGNNMWIKHLEFLQEQGKFNATIETNFSKNGFFRARAWMDRFSVNQRLWTGDLKIDGTPKASHPSDYELSLSVSNLETDGRSLPPAIGQCLWQSAEKSFVVRTLNWGPDLNFSGQIGWDKSVSMQIQCLLDNSRLKAIRDILQKDARPLKEPLSGVLRGQWFKQQWQADYNLTLGGGEVNGTTFWTTSSGTTPTASQTTLRLVNVKSQTLGDLFMVSKPADVPDTKLTGILNYKSSTTALPVMSGTLTCEQFKYGLWSFSKLKTSWESQGDRLEIKSLEGIQPDGFIKSNNFIWQARPDGTYTFNGEVITSNFYYLFKRFHGHLRLKGTVASLNPFELSLNAASPDFALHNYPYGDLRVDLHYKNSELRFQSVPGLPYRVVGHAFISEDGSVDFKRLEIGDSTVTKRASATGFIDAAGKGRSNFLVNVFAVPADAIARSFGWPQPWTGMAKGSVLYTDPGNINDVKIKVKIENGSVLDIPFDTFSGTVTIDHDWLYFKSPEDEPVPADPALREGCILRRGDKYTMIMKGKLPLPMTDAAEKAMRGAEMDLRVVLPEGDLAYLVMIPYFSAASGKSHLDLNIRGTLDYPTLSGSAWVQDGSISPRFFTPRIDHVNAEFKFDNNKTFIQRLDGQVGEGTMTIKNGSAAPWGMVFRRLFPDELNLVVETSNGRLRLDSTSDFEFITAWMTGRITLNGTLDNPRLGGIIELSDGNFTYPPKPLTPFATNQKGGNLQYDGLKIITHKNFWFANEMVRGQIKPDNSVVFRGGKNDFAGDGRIAISKGFFTYMDANFTLDSSRETTLTFQGRETPVLYTVAKTTIRDVQIKDEGRLREVTIYLTVKGPLGALKLELTSEPTMSQAQIMSLLTLGEDYSSWTQEQMDEKVQSAGARMLGRWAGSIIGQEIKNRIKKIAPVDVVDIRFGGVEKVAGNIAAGSGNSGTATNGTGNSETTGMSLLQDTQIDLGKYLTDDLYLNYRATLKDKNAEHGGGGGLAWQSLLGVEYNLGSSRKLKVTKDFDVDSGQEFYVGIESRTEFKSWKPTESEGNTAAGRSVSPKSLTPVRK